MSVPGAGTDPWARWSRSWWPVFLVALGYATYAWYLSPSRPGVTTPLGWYNGGDQGSYLTEATALAHGRLPTAPQYRYGLGYPLLAAPFKALGMHDPFAVVDVVLIAAVITLIAMLGAEWLGRRFGIACALATALATPFVHLFLAPWSNLVTVTAVLATLLVVVQARVPAPLLGVVVGFAVALTFAARYLDAVWPALIGLTALLRPRYRRAAPVLIAGAIVVAAGAVVLWTHAHVLGGAFRTPYASHPGPGGSDQGVGSYDLLAAPRRFVDIFLLGREVGGRAVLPGAFVRNDPFTVYFPLDLDPLVFAAPLIVLAPFGFRRLRRRIVGAPRTVLDVAGVVSLLATVLYLSFYGNSLLVGGLRYFVVWTPLWSAWGLAALWPRRAVPADAAASVPGMRQRVGGTVTGGE